MSLRLVTLLMALGAGPALAQCPTGADLTGAGITLLHDDGSSDYLLAGEPGTVRAMVRFSDGYGANNLYGQGVHLLQLMDAWDGRPDLQTLRIYDYGMAPTELPVPAPGLTWSIDYEVRTSDGVGKERQDQSWGMAEERTFGDCTYQVIPGEIEYTYPDGSHREEMLYFPDLGVSFLTSWQDSSMARPDFYGLRALHVGP